MRALPVALLLVAPLSFAFPGTLPAQDFRVFTTVSDVSGERPVEISRSLTLFHAGQAWDHAVETGEVVRFDPAKAEFVLLDARRELACTVKLEELSRGLSVGRKETEKEIARLAVDPAPGSKELARSLAFQLTPRYDVADDDDEAVRVGFVGGPLAYDFACAKPSRPSIATHYWDCAAWTATLNHALAPGRLFPDVHRPIHEELRARGVVPQRVGRTMTDRPGAPPQRLTAEHSFQERLDPHDRTLISEWRARLDSPNTRTVNFREYQRLTLGGAAQATR